MSVRRVAGRAVSLIDGFAPEHVDKKKRAGERADQEPSKREREKQLSCAAKEGYPKASKRARHHHHHLKLILPIHHRHGYISGVTQVMCILHRTRYTHTYTLYCLSFISISMDFLSLIFLKFSFLFSFLSFSSSIELLKLGKNKRNDRRKCTIYFSNIPMGVRRR